MKLSRRQTRDARAGHYPVAVIAANRDEPRGLSPAQTYELQLPRLFALRSSIAEDRRRSRAVADVRRDHIELERLLADAVVHAFAADAVGAATPAGMHSWAGEGMARSQERELALFAASDISGFAIPTTAPDQRAPAS